MSGTVAPDGVGIHASCVVLGEAGILIRGPSGSGKSTLARRLAASGDRAGLFARLVGDDRILLSARGGRIVARPVPALRGLLELRGIGLVAVPFEPACVVRLLVDLGTAEPERLPAEEDCTADLLGLRLPRIRATLATARDLIGATLSWPG